VLCQFGVASELVNKNRINMLPSKELEDTGYAVLHVHGGSKTNCF